MASYINKLVMCGCNKLIRLVSVCEAATSIVILSIWVLFWIFELFWIISCTRIYLPLSCSTFHVFCLSISWSSWQLPLSDASVTTKALHCLQCSPRFCKCRLWNHNLRAHCTHWVCTLVLGEGCRSLAQCMHDDQSRLIWMWWEDPRCICTHHV